MNTPHIPQGYMQPDTTVIREYIQGTILNDTAESITDDQDLLLSGLLDSMSVIRLVTWLEGTFAIKIPPEDVLVENFGSLNQMVAYMQQRL
ncbi:MAG: phosphopantetheine-binding protein [Granulosicoccus sp.]